MIVSKGDMVKDRSGFRWTVIGYKLSYYRCYNRELDLTQMIPCNQVRRITKEKEVTNEVQV